MSASYLVASSTGSLPNERTLAAGSGIAFTDAGPGSTLTVSSDVHSDVITSASFIAVTPTFQSNIFSVSMQTSGTFNGQPTASGSVIYSASWVTIRPLTFEPPSWAPTCAVTAALTFGKHS